MKNNPINYVDPSGRTGFPWHFWYTMKNQFNAGAGLVPSFVDGVKSLWVDFNHLSGFRSDGKYTVDHLMPGNVVVDGRLSPMTCEETISKGTEKYINAIKSGDHGLAFHLAQEAGTTMHAGQNFAGQNKSQHLWSDLFPSSSEKEKIDEYSRITSDNIKNREKDPNFVTVVPWAEEAFCKSEVDVNASFGETSYWDLWLPQFSDFLWIE